MQILPLRGSLGGLVRLHELIEPLGVVDRRGSPGGRLASTVQAGVDGDPVQPCGDGGLATEGVSGAEGRHKSVLHGVGSLLAVAERTQGHRPETVTMPPHELTEGIRFACDVLGQEILVADVGESGVVQR